jgi:hypothetical protein
MPSQVDIKDLTGKTPRDDKPKSSSSSSGTKRRTTTAKADTDLRGRLESCFERIAAALQERGDFELAELIADDAPVMAAGLVSLTRPFKAFRTPLLVLIAVVEPALAFGRVARVLVSRFRIRQWERAHGQDVDQPEQPTYAP